MPTILTIPRTITGDEELVVLPKRKFEEILEKASRELDANDILRWSREAKSLKKANRLPVLRSFKSLR